MFIPEETITNIPVSSVSVSLHTIHTLTDDSDCPMDYEVSLLPNIFLHYNFKLKVEYHYVNMHL